MEDEIFKFMSPNFEKLKNFGFREEGDVLKFQTQILTGQFSVSVFVLNGGKVKTKVVDNLSGEEYILHQVGGIGEFVGKVRIELDKILTEIRDKCFERQVHSAVQARELIKFIEERFGEKIEYLWKKFPTDAIWRRSDNKKWYALIMTIPESRLGATGEGEVEVLDVRMRSEEIERIVDGKIFFPGYHMNKSHWVTLKLDGTVKTEEVFRLVEESRELAKIHS